MGARKMKGIMMTSSSENISPVTTQEKPGHSVAACVRTTGGRLNKKDGLARYGNSHVKDKTS